MYTRSFNDEGAIALPDGYAGTMLDAEDRPESKMSEKVEEASAQVSGFLSGLGGIGSLFRGGRIGEFKIGTEELMIAAVALFLLFSKNGDKECAIMLLLTLFVTK